MKTDYKNWFPKGMVVGFWTGAVVSVLLGFALNIFIEGKIGTILGVLFWIGCIVLGIAGIWGIKMNSAFSYD